MEASSTVQQCWSPRGTHVGRGHAAAAIAGGHRVASAAADPDARLQVRANPRFAREGAGGHGEPQEPARSHNVARHGFAFLGIVDADLGSPRLAAAHVGVAIRVASAALAALDGTQTHRAAAVRVGALRVGRALGQRAPPPRAARAARGRSPGARRSACRSCSAAAAARRRGRTVGHPAARRRPPSRRGGGAAAHADAVCATARLLAASLWVLKGGLRDGEAALPHGAGGAHDAVRVLLGERDAACCCASARRRRARAARRRRELPPLRAPPAQITAALALRARTAQQLAARSRAGTRSRAAASAACRSRRRPAARRARSSCVAALPLTLPAASAPRPSRGPCSTAGS